MFTDWLLGCIIGGSTGIGAPMSVMPIPATALSSGDAAWGPCLFGLYGCAHPALPAWSVF